MVLFFVIVMLFLSIAKYESYGDVEHVNMKKVHFHTKRARKKTLRVQIISGKVQLARLVFLKLTKSIKLYV